jgi:hypothetical protein
MTWQCGKCGKAGGLLWLLFHREHPGLNRAARRYWRGGGRG